MNRSEYRQMFLVEDFHWWYVALHELVLSKIEEQHRRAGRLAIFDAGCGTGRLCQLMKPFGRVTGCDFAEEAVACCRERGLDGIFTADLNDLTPPSEQYDVITSLDTLYHLAIKDEAIILGRFYQALKPGGILILNLVAHEFLRSSHDVAVHTKKRYSRSEVMALLEHAGFAMEKVTYRLSFLFPLIALVRILRKRRAANTARVDAVSDVTEPHPVLNGTLLAMLRMENLLLRFCNAPFGTSVFAVARKVART